MYPECVVKNRSNTVCTKTQYKLNINHSNHNMMGILCYKMLLYGEW